LRCDKIAIAILKGRASDMNDFSHFGNAGFGDVRLSNRLPRLIGQLAGNPTASISAACQDPHQAKAAYRFVGNDEVTVDAITKITREVTIKNITEASPPVVLIPQDTSTLNYSGLKATEGLGNTAKKSSLGLEVHSAVAIGESGEVFGLLAQKIWTRSSENFGQADAHSRNLPIEEKESYKWLETLDKVGASFPGGTKAIHICDREGDIFEFFCKAEKVGVLFLVRRCYNRNIVDDHCSKKLDDLVVSTPAAGRITVRVPRDSHTNRTARNAEVEIKYGKCKVTRDRNKTASKELPMSVEVYFVSAVEIDPPEGQEKILWQLITNVPTESFEDAVTRIQWYTQRWKIETFHKTLKSGCKVEELQSETAEKLKKLIAIYSIIALQIMLLTYIARNHPDESCEICLTEDEWKILYRVANKTKKLPDKPPTIYEAVVLIAKLGGFLARKSDGFPGVVVTWRGLTSLYTILDAAPFLL